MPVPQQVAGGRVRLGRSQAEVEKVGLAHAHASLLQPEGGAGVHIVLQYEHLRGEVPGDLDAVVILLPVGGPQELLGVFIVY